MEMSESKGVVASKTVHLAKGQTPLASFLAGRGKATAPATLLRGQVARRHADQIACEPKSEIFASTWIAVTTRDTDVTCPVCREYAPFV
jgi:hypothetical protein